MKSGSWSDPSGSGATGEVASSDGSVFFLTVATMVERGGVVHGGKLERHVTVHGGMTGHTATSPVLAAPTVGIDGQSCD